jgi:hypothetical protein
MSEQIYCHTMSAEELFLLLLYQANQFELFKNFIIEVLDLKEIMTVNEFHDLFKQYKDMNKTKLLHNLMMMKPTLEDMKIDLSLL